MTTTTRRRPAGRHDPRLAARDAKAARLQTEASGLMRERAVAAADGDAAIVARLTVKLTSLTREIAACRSGGR